MIKQAISKLVDKKSLTFEEAKGVFEEIFAGETTPSQIASFLTALRIKGEVEAEILAAATVVRQKATKLDIRNSFVGIEDKDEPIMDTCGTGGSGLNKFNISTAVSFVEGILIVRVRNSSLYSLLVQHERNRLLAVLRKKFPAVTIRNIVFRLG